MERAVAQGFTGKPAKPSLIQTELESYSALLADIRAMIKQAQGRAYQAVDNIRVQTYWQIGERIVRAEYGQEVIKRLAVDLSISERNLYNAVAFYVERAVHYRV